jgi:hypothetical protein
MQIGRSPPRGREFEWGQSEGDHQSLHTAQLLADARRVSNTAQTCSVWVQRCLTMHVHFCKVKGQRNTVSVSGSDWYGIVVDHLVQ